MAIISNLLFCLSLFQGMESIDDNLLKQISTFHITTTKLLRFPSNFSLNDFHFSFNLGLSLIPFSHCFPYRQNLINIFVWHGKVKLFSLRRYLCRIGLVRSLARLSRNLLENVCKFHKLNLRLLDLTHACPAVSISKRSILLLQPSHYLSKSTII